jgi:hypothetical protein
MPIELISLITGNVSGFVFKLIASQVEGQQRQQEMLLKKQEAADNSADKAAQRGGESGAWVRRFIVIMVMVGVIIFPFILAVLGGSVTIEEDVPSGGLFGFLGLHSKELLTVTGSYFILPEIRSSVLAVVGFYFGSSCFSNKK